MSTIEEKDREPLTWAQLKEFCNSLSEEQLKQTVRAVDDETIIEISAASALGDDYYNFYEQEYSCTKDDFDPDCLEAEPPYKTIEEALEKEFHSITPASTVYLYIL